MNVIVRWFSSIFFAEAIRNNFKLQTKIILMACMAVVLSVIAIIGILYHQGDTLKNDMSLEVDKMAKRELGHIDYQDY